MRTAIFTTANLAVDASRASFALWSLLASNSSSRRNVLPDVEDTQDAALHPVQRPDGLEAFDFLHGWKGRE
ncbi:hypothetical protein [Mesorhizobium sp. CN2-181]|uniref:hypothetical protein n=1 Tax=Mesorhizobium yinganensis TaxID=3157707 RepID=UPI0032B7D6C7